MTRNVYFDAAVYSAGPADRIAQNKFGWPRSGERGERGEPGSGYSVLAEPENRTFWLGQIMINKNIVSLKNTYLPALGWIACFGTVRFLTISGHAFNYQAPAVKLFTSLKLRVIPSRHPRISRSVF